MKAVHNVRIVNGRFSSRYFIRGHGFCGFSSFDICRMRAIVFRPTIVIALMRMGVPAGIFQNTEANLPTMGNKLSQGCFEGLLVLPLNVYLTVLLTSNLH